MRLKAKDIKAINESFIETFGSGELYLFGIRVYVDRKGGDIDLYIMPWVRGTEGSGVKKN